MKNEKQLPPAKSHKFLKALAIAVVSYVVNSIFMALFGRRLITQGLMLHPLLVVPIVNMLAIVISARLFCHFVEKKKVHSIVIAIIAYFLPGLALEYILIEFNYMFPQFVAQYLQYISLVLWIVVALIPARYAVSTAYKVAPKKSKEEIAKDNRIAKIRPFYEECAKFGIKDASALTAADKRQRAELVAQKHNMVYGTIDDLFSLENENYKLYTETVAAEEAAKLEKLRNDEQKSADEDVRYSQMYGVEKRVAMLSSIVQSYRDLNNYYQKLINGVPLQKESDGAIAAGVASGIGGTVPALMSLKNTSEHNAQVRSNNSVGESLIRSYTQMQLQNQGYISFWSKEIERAKTKLVGETSTEELFKHLTIETKELEVSESGTVKVTATFKGDPELVIFNKMPAIIDGAVKAILYDGETVVGEGVVVLPSYGTGLYKLTSWDDVTLGGYKESYVRLKREKTTLHSDIGMDDVAEGFGYCLFCGKKGVNYTVKYEPINLYAIEI